MPPPPPLAPPSAVCDKLEQEVILERLLEHCFFLQLRSLLLLRDESPDREEHKLDEQSALYPRCKPELALPPLPVPELDGALLPLILLSLRLLLMAVVGVAVDLVILLIGDSLMAVFFDVTFLDSSFNNGALLSRHSTLHERDKMLLLSMLDVIMTTQLGPAERQEGW